MLGSSDTCCRQDVGKVEEGKGRAAEVEEVAAESAAETSTEEEGDGEGAEEERPLAKDWEVEPVKLHEGFIPAVDHSGDAGPAPSQPATDRQAKLAEALASDDEKDEAGKAVHKVGEFT